MDKKFCKARMMSKAEILDKLEEVLGSRIIWKTLKTILMMTLKMISLKTRNRKRSRLRKQ